MKLAISILSVVTFTFPLEVVSGCTDRSDSWAIGPKTKPWCAWARKKQGDTQRRCADKNLFDDCPVTCNSCPTAVPTFGSPPTPTTALPSPIPTIVSSSTDVCTVLQNLPPREITPDQECAAAQWADDYFKTHHPIVKDKITSKLQSLDLTVGDDPVTICITTCVTIVTTCIAACFIGGPFAWLCDAACEAAEAICEAACGV